MAVIVFASSKGGAGKSTAALLLANLLSRYATVTLIDNDPNHPIATWAEGAAVPPSLTVVHHTAEKSLKAVIKAAAANSAFVIVDLEGTAAKSTLIALSQADLVLLPTQGSPLDAAQTGRILRAIRQQELHVRENSPNYSLAHAVLLTRTNPAIRTRTTAHIAETLKAAGVRVLKTELHEREAYKAIFAFQQTLELLDPADVSNLENAALNAELFANEVISILRLHRSTSLEKNK